MTMAFTKSDSMTPEVMVRPFVGDEVDCRRFPLNRAIAVDDDYLCYCLPRSYFSPSSNT